MHRTHIPAVGTADTADETITPAVILRGAARYLAIRGWVQNVYYGGTPGDAFPPACADGAIGLAAFGFCHPTPMNATDVPGFRSYNIARAFLNAHLIGLGYRPPCDPWCPEGEYCLCANDTTEVVFAWNDDDTRTAAEVIAAFNDAADDYDLTHGPSYDLMVDAGGYLSCGCHSSQCEHSCGPRD
ncbi:hypothetical protein [Actinoplanes sp. NBRC 103695]|uniref:DUF6197 family protein n=1 Tax=Actinoplanes sp. NBRC 103695 TaxID=3032202 RepID=UPI0024A24945|nr:hypothetical protein [Actinoplanes sp. NBRC 103695]GLY97645.1 hypothetical protein Acsp02_48990 [Actinoplanes sp. NBRC 103695]